MGKIKFEFDGMEEMMKVLENYEGAVEKATEAALEAAERLTENKIEKVFVKKNMPSKGVYATGTTKRSIGHNSKVYWEGAVASIDIGFDFEKSGITSIYLMYGTPRMKPVKGLKAAIYGNASRKAQAEAEKEAFYKVIEQVT